MPTTRIGLGLEVVVRPRLARKAQLPSRKPAPARRLLLVSCMPYINPPLRQTVSQMQYLTSRVPISVPLPHQFEPLPTSAAHLAGMRGGSFSPLASRTAPISCRPPSLDDRERTGPCRFMRPFAPSRVLHNSPPAMPVGFDRQIDTLGDLIRCHRHWVRIMRTLARDASSPPPNPAPDGLVSLQSKRGWGRNEDNPGLPPPWAITVRWLTRKTGGSLAVPASNKTASSTVFPPPPPPPQDRSGHTKAA